jgi:hypothetical protein
MGKFRFLKKTTFELCLGCQKKISKKTKQNILACLQKSWHKKIQKMENEYISKRETKTWRIFLFTFFEEIEFFVQEHGMPICDEMKRKITATIVANRWQ